jgi:radical SAM-linked protein
MRVRINFDKTDAMRFTSHLDLYRSVERMLRRAQLPLAYSQGFKPHPKINIAAALPLGFTSKEDLMDVWLKETIPLNSMLEVLRVNSPPGIKINALEEIDPLRPTLQSELISTEYLITFQEPQDNLADQIQQILDSDQIIINHRGKEFDMRQQIISLYFMFEDTSSLQHLQAQFHARQGSTGRPDDLLYVLNYDLANTFITRTRLIFMGSHTT